MPATARRSWAVVEDILRTGDDTIGVDFLSSALKLKDTDIFL